MSLVRGTSYRIDERESGFLPLADSSVVYKHAALGLSGGRVRALQSGDVFAGFAGRDVDSRMLATGANPEQVPIIRKGEATLTVVGATSTSVGVPVYATADDTFTTTAGGSLIGSIVRVPSSGSAVVEFSALDSARALAAIQTPTLRVYAGSPIIVAHRGSRMTAPENSMAAFKAAYAAGIRYIEMDCQVIANGRAVVMHDTTIDRTCAPSTGAVASQTEANWKALRLSSLLAAGPAYNSEAPPFFDEVLDWASDKDVVLVVEPKGDTTAVQLSAYYAMNAELRARYWPADRVVFNSFNSTTVIPRIRQDGWRCFFNGSTPGTAEIDTAAAAGATGISWADASGDQWTPARSAYALSKGLDRWASNINRRQPVSLLSGLVDYISTDDAVYLAGVTRYTSDPWGAQKFAPGMTNGDSAAADPYSANRGVFTSAGWVLDTTAGYKGCMQGYACPVGGNASQRVQTIRFQAQFTTVANDTRWIGVACCHADDRNYQDGVTTRLGYMILFRRNAQIDIFSTPASGGSVSLGSTGAGTNLTLTTTYTFEVAITAAGVTATIYAADGTTVLRTLSVTDASAAGGWFDIGGSGANLTFIPGSLRISA